MFTAEAKCYATFTAAHSFLVVKYGEHLGDRLNLLSLEFPDDLGPVQVAAAFSHLHVDVGRAGDAEKYGRFFLS